MKITLAEFELFEKEFIMDVLKTPSYRLGQAFIDKFPSISRSMENDGDIGYMRWQELWECNDRNRVLAIIDWYIEK
jgi:hypothetical protein